MFTMFKVVGAVDFTAADEVEQTSEDQRELEEKEDTASYKV